MDYLVYMRLSENNNYTVPWSATNLPYVFVSKKISQSVYFCPQSCPLKII